MNLNQLKELDLCEITLAEMLEMKAELNRILTIQNGYEREILDLINIENQVVDLLDDSTIDCNITRHELRQIHRQIKSHLAISKYLLFNAFVEKIISANGYESLQKLYQELDNIKNQKLISERMILKLELDLIERYESH